MAQHQTGAIVVLGALFGTRYPQLIPAAGERGLTVLGVDTRTPGKERIDAARHAVAGHPLADLAELAWISGDRHEQILERILDWQATYRIRAVLAFGEDYVQAAAIVADCLDLPSPGLRAARVCRNKLLQRRYLSAFSPLSRLLDIAERSAQDPTGIAWDVFPAVVKPVGRQASSGVRRVADRAALHAALAGYEAGEPVLVEQLVEGPELSVEALVQDGEVIFSAPTGKRTNEASGEFFVEMGHTVPDTRLAPARTAAVLEINRQVLARLDFRDGVAHAEYRIDAAGRPVLMEIAARAAGDSIVTLYHLATGAPMEAALLAISLGERAGYPPVSRYARQVYLPHHPGVLRDVTADGLGTPVTWLAERSMWPPVQPSPDGAAGSVQMVVAGQLAGARLREIRESGDRCTMFVVEAATVAELNRLEARCTAAITIDVRSAESAEVPA